MKAGDVVIANTPDSEAVHGREFTLIKRFDEEHPVAGPRKGWVTTDVHDGHERYWLDEHFASGAVKPAG